MAAIESDFNKRSGLYWKIDLFITPSECYKNKLEASRLTKSPIVHMKNFLPADTKCAVQGKRGDYVLYYGRLSAEKGILTLVRTMEKLENVPLIIVGTGPEEDAIRAEIEAHHLNQRVTMVGFQSGENLWQYVRNCACVVVPSEWYEASGYTACEAQAMGKPVVARYHVCVYTFIINFLFFSGLRIKPAVSLHSRTHRRVFFASVGRSFLSPLVRLYFLPSGLHEGL